MTDPCGWAIRAAVSWARCKGLARIRLGRVAAKPWPQRLSLLDTFFRQRNIRDALATSVTIPLGFAVTDEMNDERTLGCHNRFSHSFSR